MIMAMGGLHALSTGDVNGVAVYPLFPQVDFGFESFRTIIVLRDPGEEVTVSFDGVTDAGILTAQYLVGQWDDRTIRQVWLKSPAVGPTLVDVSGEGYA